MAFNLKKLLFADDPKIINSRVCINDTCYMHLSIMQHQHARDAPSLDNYVYYCHSKQRKIAYQSARQNSSLLPRFIFVKRYPQPEVVRISVYHYVIQTLLHISTATNIVIVLPLMFMSVYLHTYTT